MDVREKLIELLMETFPNASGDRGYYACCADELIANGVTVRQKGKWNTDEVDGEDSFGQSTKILLYCNCSECGRGNNKPTYSYCPHCGADMRGEEHEID